MRYLTDSFQVLFFCQFVSSFHPILLIRDFCVFIRGVCLMLADRYGFELNTRPQPEMPRQVYMFDPITGAVGVVADGFEECNGIAFTEDGKTAYM